MKGFNWQGLLTLSLLSCVSSFQVHHERAAAISSPAGVPPISDILTNLKNRPGGACVRLLSWRPVERVRTMPWF